MKRILLAGLAALVIGCSYTQKFSKADPYYCNSLVDCLRKGPPEEKMQEGDYSVFLRTAPPIIVAKNNKIIVYIENLDGPGYCLIVKDGSDENMYCSLNSKNDLDAFSWSYRKDNQTRSMTVLRVETPSGPNGQSWEDLDWKFREAQFIFGNGLKENPNYLINPYYKGAVQRIRGF